MPNFSSSSYSFSATANINGEVSGTRQTEHVTSNDSGTTVKTTSQRMGEAPVKEVRHYDSQGRELEGGTSADTNRLIEDVSEQDQGKAEKK